MSLEHPFSGLGRPMVVGRNLIAIDCHRSGTIDFLHIPSATSRKRPERWSIPRFSFRTLGYTAYLPENILFVAERKVG